MADKVPFLNRMKLLSLTGGIFLVIFLAGCQARSPEILIPPSATSPAPPEQAAPTDVPVPALSEESTAIPAPQQAPGSSIMGIELHGGETGVLNDLAQQAGASWIRRNGLLWENVEPNRGERLWDPALEESLAREAATGAQMILIVRSTPPWAQKVEGSRCGPVKETEFQAFAQFLQDAVARYSQPPYNVKYWELGNEPDVVAHTQNMPFGCWGDSQDPYYGGGYYGEMLKVVYPAIKAANPEAQVLIGGLLMDCDPAYPEVCTNPLPSLFLEGILLSGAGNSFDGVSFHAYDYYSGALGQFGNGKWASQWNSTGPVLAAKAAFLRSVLSKYGLESKPLLNTESALITFSESCDEICQETKAIYAVKSNVLAKAVGLQANIWYSFLGWRGSGMVRRQPDVAPLPVYHAYRFTSSILADTISIQPVTGYPGVTGYELTRPTAKVWVLWSQAGDDQLITLPETPGNIWDMYGNPVDLTTNQVTIRMQPVYISLNQ